MMDGHGGTAVHRTKFGMEWPPGHVARYLLAAAEPVLFEDGVSRHR